MAILLLWFTKLAQVMLALAGTGASLMATGNTSQVDSRMGSSGEEPSAAARAVALRIAAGTPARACAQRARFGQQPWRSCRRAATSPTSLAVAPCAPCRPAAQGRALIRLSNIPNAPYHCKSACATYSAACCRASTPFDGRMPNRTSHAATSHNDRQAGLPGAHIKVQEVVGQRGRVQLVLAQQLLHVLHQHLLAAQPRD